MRVFHCVIATELGVSKTKTQQRSPKTPRTKTKTPWTKTKTPLTKTKTPWPHGLKRLMLTAEGNARSRNLLRRFGNVVEFPLQYLFVIIKSITYLSFRFLWKYFTVMMTSVLFKLKLFLRWESPRGFVGKPWCWDKSSKFESRRTCVFLPCLFPSFSFIIVFLTQLS